MTEDERAWKRKRRRLWLLLAAVLVLLAAVTVPPLVSVNRYKSRITQLMSESLGRPVRLSSVEIRALPVPEFVLTDLTVEEDPAYGAEPILRANTVTASIRLMSLWRGRVEIGAISVDEASLNLVRTAEGRWNLDPLFRTAAAKANPLDGPATARKRALPLPYLEATNSRINFKRGAEKLPFSLVNTDLSFWQEQPGDWRIRLRGQPARTDVSLDLADTGVVRLEGRAHSAPQLRQLPIHLDLRWQEAQLGQLARLLIGSDPGWRGDLTGEMHLDGTAEAAEIKTRLRATGVHRAEFAPAAPMDFDASCGFLYHFSARAMENLACDSPLGDGRIHLAGDMPGSGGSPHFSVELDRIPVAAGLDALRTVRSDFGPGLEASGSVSGKISYAADTMAAAPSERPAIKRAAGTKRGSRIHGANAGSPGPLTGSFTVNGFQLSGDGLSTPIQVNRLTLAPAEEPEPSDSHAMPSPQPAALQATVTVPAGGATPLAVTARLALAGYQVSVHGQASVDRGKELAHIAGMARSAVFENLAGDPVGLDLHAEGPWLPKESAAFAAEPLSRNAANGVSAASAAGQAAEFSPSPDSDRLGGTVTLHNATWKADFLANPVEIAQATLILDDGEVRWDPVVFAYGPVNGTGSLALPAHCDSGPACAPNPPVRFTAHFESLDAGALQAAILGAHEPNTLLSSLLARLKPSQATPAWPLLEGTVQAESLILGPVTLTGATGKLRIVADGAEIEELQADLLGGHVRGAARLQTAGDEGKPKYAAEGHFEKLSPARVGQLLGMRCSGGSFEADAKVELSGFTKQDLTSSARGTLHFDWRRGTVASAEQTAAEQTAIPQALSRFNRWTADVDIAHGAATLEQNEVQQGARKRAVDATLTLGDPPKVHFAVSKENQAKR